MCLQHLEQNAAFHLVSRWACWLQAAVRHMLQARAARRMQAAAVLQRHARGHLQRRQLARWHAAATAIQSCWRGAVQHRSFQQHVQAALVVQAAWRRWLAGAALKQQQAAVVLQRWAASRMGRMLAPLKALAQYKSQHEDVGTGQDRHRDKLSCCLPPGGQEASRLDEGSCASIRPPPASSPSSVWLYSDASKAAPAC